MYKQKANLTQRNSNLNPKSRPTLCSNVMYNDHRCIVGMTVTGGGSKEKGGGRGVEFRAFSPLNLVKITLKEVLEVPLEVLEVVLEEDGEGESHDEVEKTKEE